ncbi:hypothetical protein IBB80_00675 [Listeria marthii]|uniref:hypothetical protein n=1 Tax=Listeria marthii TaxID=529731 RepID=UPI001886B79E|nr:hypothetical protein [Listeria marthii]MBF2477144.1 hypothetical protein [Listeria marthii]MBF2493777.1 hypothetical protein [Listeria marthii]MBF2673769.1 hypothetical protein [Listeria marthii]
MKIENNSKEIILKKSEFLLHNGFKLIEITDSTITFSNKKIAFVRRNQTPLPQNKLDNILELLDYAEKNYAKVTNLQFCQESREMVKDFLKE